MDREVLINKMQEVVRDLREQLAKGEHSTMSDIGNSAKMAMESAKAAMSGDEVMKEVLKRFKDGMENFEKALKDKDNAAAGRALDQMENAINSVKAKAA